MSDMRLEAVSDPGRPSSPRPGAGDSASSELPAGVRVRRPDRNLLIYYALISLCWGPLYPLAMLYRFLRFRTLRYAFDDEGVTMRWGVLFRREISLTYARLQDIHLTSNALERWLGLGRVQLQTASGSAGAEMTIQGLKDFESIRDELYVRMRGVREPGSAVPAAVGEPVAVDELAIALRETAGELRRLRQALAGSGVPAEGGRGRA